MPKYKIPQLVPYLGQEEFENLSKVIEKRWLTEGPFSKTFLNKLKAFTGAKYAVLTNNGTLGLFLSLLAIELKKDDEVIVPNFTFIASATSIVFAGGKPVFIDVNEDDFQIDTSQIENAITSKTRAIMPVHIYGQAANMSEICRIARKHDLKIIEDAAQGFGVFYKNEHVGTIGDMGMISFFADKTITTGEGAVLLTNDSILFERLKLLRNQGRQSSGSFIHPALGMNFRITDLQSAVGVAQLKKFSKIRQAKIENLKKYKSHLSKVKEVSFMREIEDGNYIPFRCSIKVQDQKELTKVLEKNGIQTRGFFYPLHQQPCFKYLGYSDGKFPVSIRLFEDGLALPVYPELQEDEIRFICNVIKDFYK